jgi:poly-gamma-glutamate synthesis protein (capsule biosynthesis protein)
MSTIIALTGDVMLGRLVDQYMVRNSTVSPASIWGDVLPLMLSAGVRAINLECVISSKGAKWKPLTKAFHFRAHPRAIEFLRAASIDCVTLANNHVLDYGAEALEECIQLLDRAGIKHAGAGANLAQAMEPALLTTPEDTIAVVALTDNEPEWEATASRPGVFYIMYDKQGLLEPYRSRVRQAIARARSLAGLVIVSAHVGPNWGKPSAAMQALAHQIIDFGADVYWGHSNHAPQGIQFVHRRPILYSTGDFVDDYAVDPIERNDLCFLFCLHVERGRTSKIVLYPTAIEDFRVRRAQGEEVRFLMQRITSLSAEFGTQVLVRDGIAEVDVLGLDEPDVSGGARAANPVD